MASPSSGEIEHFRESRPKVKEVIAWALQMLGSLEGLRQGANLVWRVVDLCQWVWDEFHVSIAQQTLNRELCAMGYPKLPPVLDITRRPRVPSKYELGSAARLWR